MPDITELPVMRAADATAIGFAQFNDVPHKVIDIGGDQVGKPVTCGKGAQGRDRRRLIHQVKPKRQEFEAGHLADQTRHTSLAQDDRLPLLVEFARVVTMTGPSSL